jgi:methylmalonyl-CoA mutase N-terminal domain/subunit
MAAIEQGYMQQEMGRSAYLLQKEIENGERTVVGVNMFTQEESQTAEFLTLDPVAGEKQCKRLTELKLKRDKQAVEQSLSALKQAAQGTDNLMPYLIDAAKTYATLGEICGVLRNVFGEYQPDVRL